jgi:hypothetical protein
MECFPFSCALSWAFGPIIGADHEPKSHRTGAMVQQNTPSGGSRKISFNVSDQYEIQDVIGEGAYGVVWYALFLAPRVNYA